MFVQHSDPDSVEQILEEAPISESVKAKVRQLIDLRNQARDKAKNTRDNEAEDKDDRMNAPATEDEISGMLNPGEQELSSTLEFGEDSYNTKIAPNSYFAPKARISQDRAKLSRIQLQRDQLVKVRTALDGMAGFIGRLAQGERAKAILRDSARGKEIKEQIANFLFAANGFIRGYKVPVFIPREDSNTQQLNPKLLGTEGGLGNGGVALALNHMSNVIKAGLSAYANPAEAEAAIAELPEHVENYLVDSRDIPM
jgi:hypothetical protein